LSYADYVLRILSQETLETSNEVKDYSVPGPSLVKEVKDPSLTILLRHTYSTFNYLVDRALIEGIFQQWSAPSEEGKFDLLEGG
jgi:hypothetical protein